MCVGFLFPVRLRESGVHQTGGEALLWAYTVLVQACREGSAQTYLITAQMPLFIFRTLQLISVPVSEPSGKSDLLLPLVVVHVLSLTLSIRQTFKTNLKANVVFTFKSH